MQAYGFCGEINSDSECVAELNICMMANVLGIDSNKYAIIPSVGASNCVNICSILHGQRYKYIAVFDYDKAGVESGGEYMRQNLFFELGKQYCFLTEVNQSDIDKKLTKTRKTNA